jgi:choline dehydrogenase
VAPDAHGLEREYDVIVVGSGAGGGTVAARLAEAGLSVLVLEAGDDPREPTPGPGAERLPADYDVPAFHPFASENAALSWSFFVRHFADPVQAARDPKLTPNGIFYPRASALGGCTAHNAMITMWPPSSDWDALAERAGDQSWNGKAMRAYVARLEDCRHRPIWRLLSRFGVNPTGHGWSGWLPTELALPLEAWSDRRLLRMLLIAAWRIEFNAVRAFRQLLRAVKGSADPNDRRVLDSSTSGLCYVPLCTDRGRRFGARERLLAVAERHPDRLRIELNALVTRVLLDDEMRAVGVEYMRGRQLYRASAGAGGDGQLHRAVCRHEVILAGGSFNTPQLLMLSGIGDPIELSAHGIATRVALPGVGRNLQDRYEVSVVSRMASDWRVLNGARFRSDDPLFAQWVDLHDGMYASNGVALAFTVRSEARLRSPDLFCMALLARFEGYEPGYSAAIAANHDMLSWTILKARTANRAGRVRLRSADPRDMPEIDFAFFADGGDTDVVATVAAVQRVRRLLRPLTRRGLVAEELSPGPAVQSEQDIATWVRDTAWGHHASGTAAIGPRADGGVLDSRLRVHGTRGLRVVDASIFPRIPGLFIAGAVYLAAEKAADVVREDVRASSVVA